MRNDAGVAGDDAGAGFLMGKSKSRQFPKKGLLTLFSYEMKSEKIKQKKRGEVERNPFAVRRIGRHMCLLSAVLLIDCLAQAWWVVHSHNIGMDPWWVSIFGLYSGSWDYPALAFIISLLGISPALGMLFFLPALLFSQFKLLFFLCMAFTLFGIARLFGVALGKSILFSYIQEGRIDNGLFYKDDMKPYHRIYDYEILHDYWPGLLIGLILVMMVLLSLFTNRFGAIKSLVLIQRTSIITSLVLTIVIFVRMGFSLLMLACPFAVIFLSCVVMPAEKESAMICEEREYSAVWEWHAASLLLAESIFMIFAVVAAFD